MFIKVKVEKKYLKLYKIFENIKKHLKKKENYYLVLFK